MKLSGNVINFISRKIIYSSKLSRVALFFLGERFLARLVFNFLDVSEYNKDKPSCLCISTAFFDRDISALRVYAKDINWIVLNSALLSMVQRLWVPRIMQSQTFYATHASEDYAVSAWDKSTLFFESLFKILKAEHNLCAVTTGHFDYWQDEGARLACRKMNIPSIALLREYEFTDFFQNRLIKYYKEKNFLYSGDYISVAGPNSNDYFPKSGICDKNQIFVSGYPRIDMLLSKCKKYQKREKKIVTFFSYAEPFYYAHMNFIDAVQDFADMSLDDSYSDYEFVIKCKNKADYKFVSAFIRPLKHRFSITTRGDAEYFLINSRLIIGYGSTVIWEALLTDAAIIVPTWFDTEFKEMNHGIDYQDHDFLGEIYFPRNREVFRDMLNKSMKTGRQANREKRNMLFRKAFFLPEDGSSVSKRYQQFVLSSVKDLNSSY